MKYISLIILFYFGIINSFYAQTTSNYPKYHLLIGKANKLVKVENYDSALVNYTKAFKLVNYVFKKDLELAIETAKKTNSDSLESIFKNQMQQLEKGIDSEYLMKISDIFESDQKVRTKKYMNALDFYTNCITDSLCDKNSKKFVEAKTKCYEWRSIDSLDIHQLLGLMNKKGFPSEKLIGHDGAEKACIILLHFDYDNKNEILKPYLDSAVMYGNILPRNYAQIVDRRMINIKKSPVYYVVPFGYSKLTEEQKKEVDEKRASIGLLPIASSQKIIKKKHSIRVIYTE